MVQNKNLIFKSVPDGLPVPGKDLVVETQEFNLDIAPPAGGLTVQVLYNSLDPYMRGRMRSAEIKSYSPAFTLGAPITSHTVAKVLKSDASGFAAGDLVRGSLNVGEYRVISKQEVSKLEKINNPYKLDPIEFIGALGMPGLTAYASLYEIGKPKKGETIFISAASGPVGSCEFAGHLILCNVSLLSD